MNTRLSLEARGNLAFELRTLVLAKENPARLESLNDPDLQPHDLALGIYAFEFFMDRYRSRFLDVVRDTIAYSVGWSGASLSMDEETRSPYRITRMSAHLATITWLERGSFTQLAHEWKSQFFADLPIKEEQLLLFIHELFYELAYEFALEWFMKKR